MSASSKPMDERTLTSRLTAAGMSPAEAVAKARLFAQSLERLGKMPGSSDATPYLLYVPGRIEVLGKHTDYAGGRSLLATVERGFCIVALPRKDRKVVIVEAAAGLESEFALERDLTPTVGHWSNYPMTVARRVARNFPEPLVGANIAFISDLPLAAGMSSSSAMITGLFHVFSHVNGLAKRPEYTQNIDRPEALAGYLATIENGQNFGTLVGDRGVGTFGGSEDHTAICCCRPGHLHVYAFCPVRPEQVIAFPKGYVMAIGASGVLAEKTGEAMAKYNATSGRVSALLEIWRAETGRTDRCLADCLRSAPDATDRLREIITKRPHATYDAAALTRRLDQFLNENERIIPAAVKAIAEGNVPEFGRLVDQSQANAEELLENQIPQTIRLARTARECGAAAASAFGAGFGGSVWALVAADTAEGFLAKWGHCYRSEFPAEAPRAGFFLTAAGPGLIEL